MANDTVLIPDKPDSTYCKGDSFYITFRYVYSVAIIGGNVLTLVAIARFRFLRGATIRLIAGLASADLIAGILPVFLTLNIVFESGPVWRITCFVGEAISLFSCSANIMTILWIGVDRYIYIAHPLRYHSIVTPKRVLRLLLFTWIYVLLNVLLTFSLGNRLHDGVPCRYTIFLTPPMFLGVFCTQWIIYTCLIVTTYVKIARLARRQSRSIQRQHSVHSAIVTPTHRHQGGITSMMALVLGVYLCCSAPAFLIGWLNNASFGDRWHYVHRASLILWWTNAWANPLIYAWKNKDFRRAFKLLLRVKRTQRQREIRRHYSADDVIDMNSLEERRVHTLWTNVLMMTSLNGNIFRRVTGFLCVWCGGIHRSPVNSPRKGQWRGNLLMFSLICAWTNRWANHRDAGDL